MSAILLHLIHAFQVTSLLNRMQLHAKQSLSEDKECKIIVSVPPTRSDVLHPCDVVEVLIALCLGILMMHLCTPNV